MAEKLGSTYGCELLSHGLGKRSIGVVLLVALLKREESNVR